MTVPEAGGKGTVVDAPDPPPAVTPPQGAPSVPADGWVRRFEAERGRAPRVLHIGNIANNAYLNAKILRARGIECDVCVPDYYHIMGCPEWEDAAIPESSGSAFYPWWTAEELGGFERPDWFVQGPEILCRLALRSRSRFGRAFWLRVLAANRWAHNAIAMDPELIDWVRRWRPEWSGDPELEVGEGTRPAVRIKGIAALGILISSVLLRHAGSCVEILRQRFGKPRNGLARDLEREFPDRVPFEFAAALERSIAPWKDICFRYDAIIGYAMDGRIPLGNGFRPYFAFEHGTIRSLPFEETDNGKLCALTYRMADRSFITNSDNIRAAGELGLKDFVFLPHPVNEDGREAALVEGRVVRERLATETGADFVVFHPSRQHWEERRHPAWEKGNDIFIRGFARFVKEVDPNALGVFVAWGQTLGASRALLEELGIADRVRWIPPQPNQAMMRYAAAADVLADQFYLGAFGSTTPKAFLLETPAMLYLDESVHEWCFEELPPVLNTRTEDEVFESLKRVHADAAFKEALTARALAWYRRFHSNQRIGDVLVDAFATYVDPKGRP